MIDFDKFTLDNGLKVIVHKDTSTPIVTLNLLYKVGARDENPNQTGFAHLFEHLMFGGSENIDNYDAYVQFSGGENNAFTSNDFTNYYINLPKINIETAFWLESDRMLQLAFSEDSLRVQKSVVIEEFKQRYLNQPYGDVWLLMRPLVYKKHPYMWPTIGKDISHIENATLDDVKNFFYRHYAPNNAVMVVAGDVETEEVKKLATKWFGDIPKRDVPQSCFPIEPRQTQERKLTVERDVPNDAIYKAYKMCNRSSKDYHGTDLISDILANGNSSRFNQKLVKEKKVFLSLDAYISGSLDEGIFLIAGKLNENISMEEAEKAILEELEILKNELVSDYELEKVKNKFETTLIYNEISALNKAINLAYFEILGDADGINHEVDKYRKIKVEDIRDLAKDIFCPENCSTLYYKAKKSE